MRMRILKQTCHTHPLVVWPHTIIMPLLPLVESLLLLLVLILIPLLLGVMSSAVGGVLEPRNV
jgi:hypothetical protein